MSKEAPVKRRRSPKRELLLDTAFRLFYQQGFHAVGIDTILAEAGVAKMTLYHHFKSKEELIVAALDNRAAQVNEMKMAAISDATDKPLDQIAALFDFYHSWFKTSEFNGCAFIRAIGEYTESTSPVHQVAKKVKEGNRQLLESICEKLDAAKPKELAFQLYLLIEGAILHAHTFKQPQAALQAKAAALAMAKTSLD